MAASPSRPRPPAYGAIGVGFGPSNLALAVALDERLPLWRDRVRFVERKPAFGWHRGMLIEDATMQVSFLKDLVTLRNPASRFSFLAYLHDRGRLVDFVNHKVFYPSRVEYHDYLSWAADQFADAVDYGVEVLGVQPVRAGAEVVGWDVATSTGERLRTRDVVIASGITPVLPAGVTPSERVWHSAELLDRLAGWTGPPPRRFAVVGAGQSGAEVSAYLHERYPQAEVHAVVSRYGYSPADDSPFANAVFDPVAVDEFYAAPPLAKQRFYDYHANTNYSVVDLELIEELYRRSYQEAVRGRRRLHLRRMSQVVWTEPGPDRVRLTVRSLLSDTEARLDVDTVVFATGYAPMDPAAVLGPAAALCERDELGRVRVGRDYRVHTAGCVAAGIYLQGGTEHTHGLSSSLLSIGAVRAGEIAAVLLQHAGLAELERCSDVRA